MVLLLPVNEVAYRCAGVLEVHTAVSYPLFPKFPFTHRSYSGNGDNMSSTIVGKGGEYHIPLIFVSGYEP